MDRMEEQERLVFGYHHLDRIQDNDLRLDSDSLDLDLDCLDSLDCLDCLDSLDCLGSLDSDSLDLSQGMVRLERLALECLDKDVHHSNHYFQNLMVVAEQTV